MTFAIGDRILLKSERTLRGTISRAYQEGDDSAHPEKIHSAWWITWDDDGQEAWSHVSEIELVAQQPMKHSYSLNAGDPAWNQMRLDTFIHDRGTEDQFIRQELVLISNCRTSTFALPFDFSPSQLRELADQLEQFVASA